MARGIGFVSDRSPDLKAAPATQTAPYSRPDLKGAPAPHSAQTTAQHAPTALESNGVDERIMGLVVEKTGYPRDMLDLDLDLEADLGVDTVKQAEKIGRASCRERV